jgi:acetyl-CoA carboxylase biotin carboxyl carrier protein
MSKLEIKAEVTGSVWKVLAKVGDQVEEDDELMILESMKMEIPIMAPEDGVVKEIRFNEEEVCREGETVVILDV